MWRCYVRGGYVFEAHQLFQVLEYIERNLGKGISDMRGYEILLRWEP